MPLATENTRYFPEQALSARPETIPIQTTQPAGAAKRPAGERNRFFNLFHRRNVSFSDQDGALKALIEVRLDAVQRLLDGGTQDFAPGTADEFRELRNEITGRAAGLGPAAVEDQLTNFLAHRIPAAEPQHGACFGKLRQFFDLPSSPSKAAKQKAHSLIKEAMVEHLNSQPWRTIHNTFPYEDNWYNSRMTPAGQMKLGTRCIFPNDYDGKGTSSGSSSCTDHAVNLWMSEFISSPQPLFFGTEKQLEKLFRGIRHGILSPYGIDDADQRREGALNRAREVVAAALYMRLSPTGLGMAMHGAEPVQLKLASMSLVTAMNWGKNTEGSQLKDQMDAWERLAGERPVKLTLYNEQGLRCIVKVDLQVAAFNFGVNEFALDFGAGARTSDRRNRKALLSLCGSEDLLAEEPGGWVGAYLAGNPENAGRVRYLYRQIRDIWMSRSHRKDDGEPYKLPARLALLCHEIGVVPCYNCKSGKDRTAWLDQEIKFGAIELHKNQSLPEPGSKLSQAQRRLFGLISKNSGNFEIQRQNTGVGGNKVIKERSIEVPTKLSLSERLPDEQAVKNTRGLSGHVKA